MTSANSITKKCNHCRLRKLLSLFGRNKAMPDGLSLCCKKCKSESYRKYSRTKRGLIQMIYLDQKKSSIRRGYEPPKYSKTALLKWAISQPIFHDLYNEWAESGHKKHMRPSFDRTDDYKRYSLERLQIMTWQENNDKGRADTINGVNKKRLISVDQLSANGVKIKTHHSMSGAQRLTGVSKQGISSCCKGGRKSAGGYVWRYAPSG